MKYSTVGAFRQVLEERLRQQALKTGIAMFRLRKMVAFNRLLARLAAQDRTFWILKGGILLQWLVGWRARATSARSAGEGLKICSGGNSRESARENP